MDGFVATVLPADDLDVANRDTQVSGKESADGTVGGIVDGCGGGAHQKPSTSLTANLVAASPGDNPNLQASVLSIRVHGCAGLPTPTSTWTQFPSYIHVRTHVLIGHAFTGSALDVPGRIQSLVFLDDNLIC